MLKVKEVADLTGISVRTLHYYDEIGLLCPSETTDASYRIYSNTDLEMLQQILFFKEMGFSLKKIKEVIHSSDFDRIEALELHRNLLIEKRNRLDQMVKTVDKTIQHAKGEMTMTNKEKFEGFDFSQNPYEQEAREKYGDQAVEESKQNIVKMNPEKIKEETGIIFTKLAKLRYDAPDSDEAQGTIGEWYHFLNRIGEYSPEAFRGLGQLYIDDERFTQNIDQYGEGLAAFMKEAMAHYADRKK
ncbi:MerR family transcriptional regulator [Pontibacillus sp. ALD_SL1]|uniref:MerR family transcriptional regulator n=1 Tax=Pontibacillus sp. ALD_SL1 TaxID=2777185 RepID=UPI001A9596D5|nr:MerR family transcriptional regulator [Pontibacillus sp. ALD_SL1]QST00650.1 MerR family transcriptional regulator [Pontibacillus sp. ALD_SL1]